MSQRTRSVSPQLRAFKMLRLLDVLIDAWADHNWALWETTLLAEFEAGEGWNSDEATRVMRNWGARDQHGIYAAAGLTERQAEVAYFRYERRMTGGEIARALKRPIGTVDRQLWEADQRLKRLATEGLSPRGIGGIVDITPHAEEIRNCDALTKTA